MSVLSFPRLYFSGTMSWDPIVSNNSAAAYNAVTARAGLQPGETLSCFRQRMINSTVLRGTGTISAPTSALWRTRR